MKIISKGNWKNFYGYDKDGIHEILKVRERFYRCKYVIGEWLRPVGDALKKSEFTLQE